MQGWADTTGRSSPSGLRAARNPQGFRERADSPRYAASCPQRPRCRLHVCLRAETLPGRGAGLRARQTPRWSSQETQNKFQDAGVAGGLWCFTNSRVSERSHENDLQTPKEMSNSRYKKQISGKKKKKRKETWSNKFSDSISFVFS